MKLVISVSEQTRRLQVNPGYMLYRKRETSLPNAIDRITRMIVSAATTIATPIRLPKKLFLIVGVD
jgi:hypothetical protein